ncbi:MAG: UPF0175 family protein [Thermoplasmatota archaeon]
METIKTKIELPRSIMNICGLDENELPKEVAKNFIIELYREGTISLGKAAEFLGMTKKELMVLLDERNIPLNYDSEELKKDRDTWEKLNLED